MELLVFGHAGLPVLVFPTSGGRFYEFEDQGMYDQDCYFHLPTHYLPNLTDPWFLDRFRGNRYALATGWDDQCLGQNQNLDCILSEKGIPHQFYVWASPNSHDWPTWQQMAQHYL